MDKVRKGDKINFHEKPVNRACKAMSELNTDKLGIQFYF